MTNQIGTFELRDESTIIISLGDLNFFCKYNKSNNGQYLIATCDGDPFNHIGGHRKEGKGFYFLISDNKISIMGQIERPNDGKVADNGWFIINDWLFTNNIESIAYCFDKCGNSILSMKLNANLLSNAISKNGQFALFQTANSDNEFGNNLFFFDLRTQQQLWRKQCDFAWPKSYSIHEDERKIILNYSDIGIVSLDWDGNIIDKQNYQLKYVSSLIGDRRVNESIRLITEGTSNTTFINLLEDGVNDNKTSPNTKATGFRFLGELYEHSNLTKALLYFEKAIEHNPKIGLKRRLNILKSKL